MKVLVAVLLTVLLVSAAQAAEVDHLERCKHLEKSAMASIAHPADKKLFLSLISDFQKASKSSRKIEAVNVPVSEFYFCAVEEGAKTGFSEKQLDWLNYVSKSRFTEGRKFIESKLFQSTLDGAYAEMFRDEAAGEPESALIPGLKINAPGGKSIFWATDVKCFKTEKRGDHFTVSYQLNDYATTRLQELTRAQLHKDLSVSICGSKSPPIKVSAEIKSGHGQVENLKPSDVLCLNSYPECPTL